MDEFERAARDNVERHLGDVCGPDDDPDDIRAEVFALAVDGAHDAGASLDRSREIANLIHGEF